MQALALTHANEGMPNTEAHMLGHVLVTMIVYVQEYVPEFVCA